MPRWYAQKSFSHIEASETVSLVSSFDVFSCLICFDALLTWRASALLGGGFSKTQSQCIDDEWFIRLELQSGIQVKILMVRRSCFKICSAQWWKRLYPDYRVHDPTSSHGHSYHRTDQHHRLKCSFDVAMKTPISRARFAKLALRIA